jgi:hypothetical protein
MNEMQLLREFRANVAPPDPGRLDDIRGRVLYSGHGQPSLPPGGAGAPWPASPGGALLIAA